MKNKYQSIRGMHDFLPKDTILLQNIEKIIKKILNSYTYSEIRFPILEKTELFKKTIGYETDIIKKEMYNFYDHNKKKISLRPEGTVGCIRACIQNNIFYVSKIQKLWYYGPMFRYERPQKGRFRQFYQFGVEVFGIANPIIDYEIILLTIRLWKNLEILQNLTLEINSIGSILIRQKYSIDLMKFIKKNVNILNCEEKQFYFKNPIRLLDSKNKYILSLLKDAPKLKHYLDYNSILRFKKLCNFLNKNNINYVINNQLVRGLEYYNDTVFEWKTNILGTQNTICAGGRYDKLVKNLGGPNNPAIGFAIGIDRLLMLKKTIKKNSFNFFFITDIHIVFSNPIYSVFAIHISEKLHSIWPNMKIYTNINKLNLSNQIRYSIKQNTKFLLILDTFMLNINKIYIKNLNTKVQNSIYLYRIFQNPCIFL